MQALKILSYPNHLRFLAATRPAIFSRKFHCSSTRFSTLKRDPWTLLGLARGASEEDIKKAWRKVKFRLFHSPYCSEFRICNQTVYWSRLHLFRKQKNYTRIWTLKTRLLRESFKRLSKLTRLTYILHHWAWPYKLLDPHQPRSTCQIRNGSRVPSSAASWRKIRVCFSSVLMEVLTWSISSDQAYQQQHQQQNMDHVWRDFERMFSEMHQRAGRPPRMSPPFKKKKNYSIQE